ETADLPAAGSESEHDIARSQPAGRIAAAVSALDDLVRNGGHQARVIAGRAAERRFGIPGAIGIAPTHGGFDVENRHGTSIRSIRSPSGSGFVPCRGQPAPLAEIHRRAL